MQVTSQHISNALSRWFERDVMPKGDLFQQGISLFVFLQAKPRLNKMIDSLAILSDGGKFDVDELIENLRMALEKMGGAYTLPIIGYKADADDLERIAEYLRAGQ